MGKKFKDLKGLSKEQKEEKVKDLRFELVKNSIGKGSKIKNKEIKKAIARLLHLQSGKTHQ